MILKRLVELYDRLVADPKTSGALPMAGYSLQKCGFCVDLKPDGTLIQFKDLRVESDNGKKQLPRQLLVPGQAKPSGSGLNPCFLWDNAAYMLGFKPDDPKPDRTKAAFEAFRDKHLELESEIDDPAYKAICAFLRNWSPEKTSEHADLANLTAGCFGVFMIAGHQQFVHQSKGVVAYWEAQQGVSGGDSSESGWCLVTGKQQKIARLHEPKIKGVWGTQSAGALLVSFNDDAYESFGKEQGDNAPVSEGATFKYTNALNYLLNRRDRRIGLGDATVVFWADQPTLLEDAAAAIFGDWNPPVQNVPAEDKARTEQVHLLMDQLRQGQASVDAMNSESNIPFYILGLSPNASRISIRFWIQSDVLQMKQRLAQHLQDIEMDGAREGDDSLNVRRLILATGRAETDASGRVMKYDEDAVSPLLAGAVARAIFTGGPYPQTLLGAMINRIRADGVINHLRVAAIKGCLVRNSRLKGNPKEVPVSIDTTRTESAYVTGRLFALLEKIQSDSAGGELNATIKDRYFSAASATPASVFPRLIRLSQFHTAKMEKPQKIYYEKQLGEVMDKLAGFDRFLNLEDQGLFAVGYFHQRQFLFTKKTKEEGETK